MTVYWTSVEYEYKYKNNLRGGFVYIFIKARDAISAYEIIKEDLISKDLISEKKKQNKASILM